MSEVKLVEERQKQHAEFMRECIDGVKAHIKSHLDAIASDLNAHYGPWIDTDAWTNYREEMKAHLARDIHNTVVDSSDGHWARKVRQAILDEHREDLIKALNQDLVAEVERLKEEANNRRGFF